MLVSTVSSTSACAGSVAAGPLKTPRRNQRGPSNPTNRSCCFGHLSRRHLAAHAGVQFGPEVGFDLVDLATIGAHRFGNLSAYFIPDATVPGRRKSQHLQRIRAVHDGRRDRLLRLIHLDPNLSTGQHRHPQAPEVESRHRRVATSLLVVKGSATADLGSVGGTRVSGHRKVTTRRPVWFVGVVGRPDRSCRPSCRARMPSRTSACRIGHDRPSEAAAGSIACGATIGPRQLADLVERGVFDPLDHQLSDPVPGARTGPVLAGRGSPRSP